ncbi:MAG TPA: SRPBCC domain-containing protein [Bacteroidota bacterium]|nr:SRPBCC domain-containing protein [Bacteroidota bacterium]
MKSKPIVIERTFDAPVSKVWEAITDVKQMKQWYFPALEAFKPEVGFQTQFNVNNGGKDYLHIWKVTEVKPGKNISYEWRFGGYPGNSLVTFALTAVGRKTTLTLTHEGIETFLPDKNPPLARKNFIEGWTALIGDLLKKFVEK